MRYCAVLAVTTALLLVGIASATRHAVRSTVEVENEGVTFKISDINDGKRYEAAFTLDGINARLHITDDMELQSLHVGDDMYPVTYDPSSADTSVTYPTIQAPISTVPPRGGGKPPAPFACDDCKDTYDFLCTPGWNGLGTNLYEEACDTETGLSDPNDELSETAALALQTFCDYFPCSSNSVQDATEVCEAQCESGILTCTPALTVTLEWEGFGDLELWVREPGDDTNAYSTSSTNVANLGDLDQTGDWSYWSIIYGTEDTEDLGTRSITYSLDSGLFPDEAVGDYEVWVRLFVSAAPVSWSLRADVNGQQVLSEEGTFEDSFEYWASTGWLDVPRPESEHFTISLDEYIDNDCVDTGS